MEVQNIFMIYELKFSYYEDNSENNDEIIIAVYSSYKKGRNRKEKIFHNNQDLKEKRNFWKLMNIRSMKQSGMKVFGEQQNHIL